MTIVRAPARISFGGGGTDLEAYYARFGGFVVSAAITRYSYVSARVPAGGSISIRSVDYRIHETYRRGEPIPVGEPLALPKAALAEFLPRGLAATGVDLTLASEVPPGTGLGSSSAMACALVAALADVTGARLSRGELAEAACRLEIERLQAPIGKQDQYASAFGGLNTLTFTTGGVEVRRLPLRAETLRALSDRLLLFSTGRTRSAGSILAQQRADTQSDPHVIASLHALKALAGQMCERLLAADLDGFGALLDQAWQEKKRVSGRISSAAIDAWYDAAREAGALGGKITGAGGGGYLLLYCPPARQGAVRAAMAAHGLSELTFDLDGDGARMIASDEQAREALGSRAARI